uniref:tandem-95 repeat protein n=1 Tax=Rubrolithibacter danxiaensis TaxID=3390805 RepID=UPI003BF851D9
TATDLTTPPTATTAATTGSAAGTYAITAAGGVSANYDFTYTAGTLTIGKATLAVTADDQSRTYGSANPALTVSYSGFVNGDTATDLTTPPTATTAATTGSAAGTYAITAAGGVSSNYDFTYTAGTLTIGKATLAVTAEDKSRTYGSANPALTVSYTGFVNGDTATDLTTAPTATTAATTGSAAGTYAITAAGGASANYDFTYTAGTLTIGKATLTVTAVDESKTYDATNYTGGNGVTYDGFVNSETVAALNGTLSYTGTSQGAKNIGNYVIIPGGYSSNNYLISYVNGHLEITPKVLTVTLTGSVNKDYDGNANATLTSSNYILKGVIDGDRVTLKSPVEGIYNNKNVGTSKSVTVNGISIEGTDATNYILASTTISNTVGSINLIANNAAVTTNEDVAINNRLSASDVDNITYSKNQGPSHGTLVINADGSYVYTPYANYNGTDQFTYTVKIGTSISNTATVNITIVAVNDPPVAVNDFVVLDEDAKVFFNVLSNDTDEDGTIDAGSVNIVRAPVHGKITVNDAGTVSYVPSENFNGSDTFQYTVKDNEGALSNIATVSLTINPVNDNPVAPGGESPGENNLLKTIVMQQNTSIKGNVPATDPDGDKLGYQTSVKPAHGALVIDTDGGFTYTPATGYSGEDAFLIKIDDGNGGTILMKFEVTIKSVNTAPVAANDTYIVKQNDQLSGNILDNDTDADFDGLVASTVSGPSHGKLTLKADGTFTYNPDKGYSGSDKFTYKACDKNPAILCSNIATVTITVKPVPVLGLAKAASEPKLEANGSYTVSYKITVKNLGKLALTDVEIKDDLVKTFPAPMQFSILGNVKATGKLEANSSYNGRSVTDLLSGNSTLDIGKSDTVSFTVNIIPNKNFGIFNNVALGSAECSDNQKTTDISTNGSNPDPDNDTSPEERIPTPVVLKNTTIYIPGGFSPNNDGVNDKFVIENIGNDRISLEIYNRWGNMVYKNPNYKNEWEGRTNQGIRVGEDLPDGTYYYIVIVNGKTKFASFLTIKR